MSERPLPCEGNHLTMPGPYEREEPEEEDPDADRHDQEEEKCD
jgi:hypothetical protein